MKCQAEILLLKNKLRLMKGTIRHTWQGLIEILVVGGVLVYRFFFVIAKAEYGTGATARGVFYTLLFVAVINLFRVFLNQTPVFRVEAASVLNTYNTGYFTKILARKQFLSVLYAALAAGMIACILSGFLFNLVFLKLWLAITLYTCNCTFLSWIFYHAQGRIRWSVCAAFLLCTFLLFVHSLLTAAISAISLCAVWLYVRRFLRLNLPKYNERLQSLEAASVAVSQNDYTRMQKLADENRPSYVRGPMLYQFKPTKRTALWIKSLLELFRMQKQAVVILALLLFGGWLVSRTKLLTIMPLLEDPAITRVLSVLCTTTAFSSLYQLLIKQAKTVSDKRKLGLSLPYSTRQIIVSYGMTAMTLILFLTLVISLLYSVFSIRLIPLLSAEVIAYLAPCCTQLYETKYQRGAITFSNMLLFAGLYYLLIT